MSKPQDRHSQLSDRSIALGSKVADVPFNFQRNHFNTQSRGFENSRYLVHVVRRFTFLWLDSSKRLCFSYFCFEIEADGNAIIIWGISDNARQSVFTNICVKDDFWYRVISRVCTDTVPSNPCCKLCVPWLPLPVIITAQNNDVM